MEFDARYQDGKDGPLKKEVRDRLTAFRTMGFTLAEIGEALSFSGPFISQILNSKTPARVRTIHVPRIIEALEEAERKHLQKQPASPVALKPETAPDPARMSLDDHIRAIDALGYTVTVTLKQK